MKMANRLYTVKKRKKKTSCFEMIKEGCDTLKKGQYISTLRVCCNKHQPLHQFDRDSCYKIFDIGFT